MYVCKMCIGTAWLCRLAVQRMFLEIFWQQFLTLVQWLLLHGIEQLLQLWSRSTRLLNHILLIFLLVFLLIFGCQPSKIFVHYSNGPNQLAFRICCFCIKLWGVFQNVYSSYNLLDSVIAIRDVESKEIGKEKREREKKKRSIIIYVLVIIMEHDFSFCTYALFYVLLCTNILARYKYSWEGFGNLLV